MGSTSIAGIVWGVGGVAAVTYASGLGKVVISMGAIPIADTAVLP
jgi:predicted cobalt transporter CbtA